MVIYFNNKFLQFIANILIYILKLIYNLDNYINKYNITNKYNNIIYNIIYNIYINIYNNIIKYTIWLLIAIAFWSLPLITRETRVNAPRTHSTQGGSYIPTSKGIFKLKTHLNVSNISRSIST